MKHEKIEVRSALPIETREDDPLAIATQAVEELRAAADERHTAHQTEVRSLTERLASMETRLNRPGTQQEQRNEPTADALAFGVYLRRGAAALNAEEQRALTVATDASAGYLAPPEYGNEILRTVVEYSPIRAYARVMQIAGPEIRYPKKLTGTNAQWVSEIEDRPESTMTFGQVTLTPFELATFVDVSKQLLEDAAYDVEGELRTSFAEDFGVKEGAAFVNGDGAGKPKGILQATGIQQIVTGAAATLGTAPADLLIDAMSKLPSVYAQNGAWLMNRTTLASIRKLKDAQGAYLWQPSLQVGAPSTLLGRPIIEAVDMPSIAAGAFPIVFGDFSGYRIVDRVGVSVLVDPFTKATNGITRFHARKRVGADVTHPDRFVKVKVAAS
ncbi:phage major capsid protein [Agrobacterium sp. rho-13.3]|uniref:phage major capsid protein n=1 Tax=Agrobacterium sp. rho-13.3 TaxID=3072980 RepID=UPI002A0D95B8|nr:phage major capsid protein [Agrobacterium sp. rho-13.3]MDX8309404.1 phage major capsid protein [Agrobacterium sp. rho-13.3]